MFWDKIFGDSKSDQPDDGLEADLPPSGQADIISAETLAMLAGNVEDQLRAIDGLIRQSGHDARSFSQSLEDGATKLAEADDSTRALTELMTLTRAMVEKTRLVEAQLRHRTEELSLINKGLNEARKDARDWTPGLRTRREFERELGSAVERARIQETPISVALCDVDRFAAVNAAHGPDTGDRVISFVGALIDQIVDNRGMVCRGLGAEFLILFDGKSARQARDITEEARQALVDRNIVDRQSGRRVGHLNFSAGIGALGAEHNISLMLARADRALQRAKTSARGSVKIG